MQNKVFDSIIIKIRSTIETRLYFFRDTVQNIILIQYMIIEPKWSLRPADWDLSAFNIIPILVGVIPFNSLLVSMALS